MIATSGRRLMHEEALDALIGELFPVAHLITPNIPEAELLSGVRITSEAEMLQAAAIIRGLGARAVLVKGGHLLGARASCPPSRPTDDPSHMDAIVIDVLDNEGKVTVFRERRIAGVELHGSGCILSAAIAAGLGKGMALEDAVGGAKTFVWEALRETGDGSSESNP
jgi:hydroxymethylpyrimidine/phosphomethylpyrimidine kinase